MVSPVSFFSPVSLPRPQSIASPGAPSALGTNTVLVNTTSTAPTPFLGALFATPAAPMTAVPLFSSTAQFPPAPMNAPATNAPVQPTPPQPVSMPAPQNITPVINSPNIQNNPQLQQSIAKIQQDPIGAQLLNTTLAKGYTIRVGNPGSATEPGVIVEGVTFTNGPNGNEIIINPNARDFDKILVHELYHAASEEDGNSQFEEGLANIVGDQVSARVNNRTPQNPFRILLETLPLYRELPLFN
jgi:hypothetical protein